MPKNSAPRTAFENVRDFMDKEVQSLAQADYAEFLEELAGEIQCRITCVKAEMEENGN